MRATRPIRLLVVLLLPVTVAAALTACGSAATASTRPSSVWRDWQNDISTMASDGRFSGTVLATQNGRRVVDRSYGGTRLFDIASLGKMFTGVAIAQLVQAGRLAFGDQLGRYVSGFPATTAKATVTQLLTHTAGLGDAALMRTPDSPEPPRDLAEMLDRVRAAPVRFDPGKGYAYSNDGYIVLGAIIERVTHQPWSRYVDEHVLRPAGMGHTSLASYALPSGAVEVPNPSGGARSTAGDLLSFARALLGHRLLSRAMTSTVMTGKVKTDRLTNGVDSYGYGFADQTVDGVRIIGHSGGNPEFEAQLAIVPADHVVAVVLADRSDAATPVIDALRARLAGRAPSRPTGAPA